MFLVQNNCFTTTVRLQTCTPQKCMLSTWRLCFTTVHHHRYIDRSNKYNTYRGKNPTKHNNTSTQHAPVRSTRDNSIYQAVRDSSLANGSSTQRKKMPVSQCKHGVQSKWAVITLKDMTLFLTGCCEMCHSLAMRNHFDRTEDCSWIPCTNKETYFRATKQLAYTQKSTSKQHAQFKLNL